MPDFRTALTFLSAIILIAGLFAAALIYRSAVDAERNALGYVQGDGTSYPVTPEDSKKYLRDMELYGGKANVLADELRRWFSGLWHGKSLAYTVAVISILLALGVYGAGRLPPLDDEG